MNDQVKQLQEEVLQLQDKVRRLEDENRTWQELNRRLEQIGLDPSTDLGQLNAARAAALVYGQHMAGLCKAPQFATKVHGECTCGLSDFLLGRGINDHVAAMLVAALKHIEYGKTLAALHKALEEEAQKNKI